MRKQIEKWIDLSELPKWGEHGKAKKGSTNWKESVGYKCKFKYDDIEGWVEIIDYIPNNNKLIIKYLNCDLFEIDTRSFKKCSFGELLKKKTSEFKIKIGQTFLDDKRDLVIIDREYRKNKRNRKCKYYKYHCNKCGNEDWINEGHLPKGVGCNVCCDYPRKVILGVNTIWDKTRWMVDLGVSEKDAKKYTPNSSKKITVKCPYCNKEKKITPNTIYTYKSIGCTCGDRTSYPEKIMMSILDQLNINYIVQYSPEWIKPKRYDFYFKLNNKRIVVETHGEQHYTGSFSRIGGKTLEEEQKNDQYKRELALSNGVDFYIELDCRKSNLDWIKDNIINSELNNIFDLNNIDWTQCEELSLKNKIREVCDYWYLHNNINKEDLNTNHLSKIFNLCHTTISNYLKKGNDLGWCTYNSKKEVFKGRSKAGKMKGKQVEIFDKSGQSLGVFNNCHELERQSENLFGVKLNFSNISEVARGKKRTYKGFTFKYVEN